MHALKNAFVLAAATLLALVFLYFAFVLTLAILVMGAIFYLYLRLRVMFGKKPVHPSHVLEESQTVYSSKNKEKIIIIEHEENKD